MMPSERFQNAGISVLSSSDYFHCITVRVPENLVATLTAYDWVSWVETISPPVMSANDGSRASINVNQIQAAPYSLSGNSVHVGVWDEGSIPSIANFTGRLTVIDAGSRVLIIPRMLPAQLQAPEADQPGII